MHTQTIQPTADPLPWVTAQMDRGRVFDKRLVDATRMRAALDVLTANVAALHDSHPYRVVLSKALSTAGTAYAERLVLVGSKPLYDDDLTNGQQAAVVMGLVLHEVGHVRWASEYDAALAASPVGNSKLVGSVSNLAADMHNERAAMDLFPGLAHAVEVAMWWVDKHQPDVTLDLTTVAGRANAALAACRYPWRMPADTPPEWLATWADWAERAEQAGEPDEHVAIVTEALGIIRDIPETPTPPDPEDPTEPPEGPTGPSDDEDPDEDPDDEGGDTEGGDDPTDTEDGDDEPDDQPGGGNDPDDGDDGDDTDDGDDDGGSDGGDDGDDGDSDEGGDPAPGDEDGDDGDDGSDGGESGDDGQTSEDPTGSTGGGDEDADPYDEDSDDIQDACSNHAAHGERDERIQSDIERTMLSERTSGTTYIYRHSTSYYDERKVVVARKTSRGFNV